MGGLEGGGAWQKAAETNDLYIPTYLRILRTAAWLGVAEALRRELIYATPVVLCTRGMKNKKERT